jgi:putative ABC transport system substrate-binding protein
MKRREFITVLGAGAVAWPLVARGQQSLTPRVGWLSFASPESSPALPFFQQGLADVGYVEGRNVVLEYRWARSHPELFPTLAAELVQSRVSVIAAVSGVPAARAAKAATSTIPIVFITPGDPVQSGLVASLNRPGGNLTGLTMTNTVLTGKQIELMHEILPSSRPLAIMSDPNTESDDLETNARLAERTLGRPIIIVYAGSEKDFDAALVSIAKEKASGLIVPDRPLFVSRHTQIAALVARSRIPTMFHPADLAASGGLISYGASTFDMFRRAGLFVGRILNGARPADLPVEQPTRIELKINLKAAKTLGLEIPPTLLARADEVME